MISDSSSRVGTWVPCKSKVCTTRWVRSMTPSRPPDFLALFCAGFGILSRMVLEIRAILRDSGAPLKNNRSPNPVGGEGEKSFPTNAPRRGRRETGSWRWEANAAGEVTEQVKETCETSAIGGIIPRLASEGLFVSPKRGHPRECILYIPPR